MNFKLSDAISKLETMEQNEVLPFDSFDGYPETVESFKTNLEEIMDLDGDISILVGALGWAVSEHLNSITSLIF